MVENYQPVVLRKLLLSKGSTKSEIEEELKKYNSESTSKSMTDTVLGVLQSKKNNMVRKEGYKFIVNSSHELSPEQIKELVDNCEKRIEQFNEVKNMPRFFIALGPWSNWEHTINNPPFRWGVNPSSTSNVGVFRALRLGDIVFYYANQDKPTKFSKRGLFGVGRVTKTYDENLELYWPDEKLHGKIIYKHRFEIESIKLVQTDSEMLPWIDGLPFTKGLNRVANKDNLKQLIDNTEKIWDITLNEPKINYILLRHSRSSPNQWKDDIGKQYNFGKIPNYKKLIPGTRTIWYDRDDGDFYYWGYGEISRIEKQSNDRFHAHFNHFNYFYQPVKPIPKTEDVTPKKGLDSTTQKIKNLPGWNNQISMIQLTKEIHDEIITGEEKSITFNDDKLPLLSYSEIKTGYEKISNELLIPEEKIIEIITALASGRHVLLAGPIGTGKTRLAKLIPEIFWDQVGGYYSEDHTATADWSTQDVIGGIYPKMENEKPVYDIQNGCVVDTVRKNWENGVNGGMRIPLKEPLKSPPYKGTWLIIDEFNRADIDKAFGQLFTALRTRQLKIPTDMKGVSYKNLKIPEDYRIIGTLNTADKHFLFQLSDALKSRFAYIEVDIPKPEQQEKEIYYAMKNALDELGIEEFDKIRLDHKNKKINKGKSEEDFYNRMMQAYVFLDTVRVFKKLGTAILKLIFQNLIVGTIMTKNSKTSLDNALTSNLIPQLENISITFVSAINSMHSDNLLTYLKDAYKSPNRQSYVQAFEKILDYLQIKNKNLVSDFANGNMQIDNEATWKQIETAYDNKKKDFETGLEQIKQSMDDLVKSMVI